MDEPTTPPIQAPGLIVERCKVCHFEVSAVSKRALRACLADHGAYHVAVAQAYKELSRVTNA